MKNKNYPLNEVEPVSNLKELVMYAAEKHGAKPAFTFERNGEFINISYQQFKADVSAIGTFLLDMGFRKAKIAVIGENSYEWLLTYFATVNSGNIIVPLDRELPVADIVSIINDSGTEIFVYPDGFDHIAEYLKKNNAGVRHFYNTNMFPDIIKKGNALIQQGDTSMDDYIIDNRALSSLLYTSGTTGVAKGVMLSHLGLTIDAVSSCKYIWFNENNMLVLPLHHTFALTAVVCGSLLEGSEIFINSNLKNILSDMGNFKPYNMFLVPLFVETFYKRIWDGAKSQGKDKLLKKLIKISNALLRAGIDLRHVLFKSVLRNFGGNLKLIVCGGAPLDNKYIQGLRDLGIYVLNGYGITECSPVVSCTRNFHYRDGSVGLVLPCCEVKILNPDEDGHGEICVKGDIVMLGYYNNEQATKEAFDGEWFKTGDIGYLDDDGFLFISGRKKNLIVLNNGKNVHPEEIESALLVHISYIKEAVVYAKDNIIIAEVFLDVENGPNCVSHIDDDIIKLNRSLPPYMSIGKVVIRETEFVKTTTKKIKRSFEKQSLNSGEKIVHAVGALSESEKNVIIDIVKKYTEKEIVTPDSLLKYDLELNSLSMLEISVDLEAVFGEFKIENFVNIERVRDLFSLVGKSGHNHTLKEENHAPGNDVIEYIKGTYHYDAQIIENPTCYFYDLEVIKNNINEIEKYAPPQISLYYAMKANPNTNILSCMRELDYITGIEIASSGELSSASEIFNPDEIIFTGPGKTEHELELSIKKGIRLINVESVVEAIRINNIAKELNIGSIDILLRINPNYYISDAQEHMAGQSSKMGIDEDKYIDAYKIINDLDRVRIRGIHVFAASGVLEYGSLIKYATYIFDLVSKLENSTGKIDIIDFGGGIGIDYSDNNKIFDIQAFFNELTALITQYGFESKELIMELGTYLVGNAGYYTSKIIDLKEIKGHKHIIIAGGINHMGLPFEMQRKHPLHIIPMHCDKLYDSQPFVKNEQADISGPLCMCSDKLSWGEHIEEANIGDIVVFRQSGAYCYSLGVLEFLNHPRPKELFIVRQEYNFALATKEDIKGILEIEKEFFGDYIRFLDEKMITKWFNHNSEMFYVVKNQYNDVLAFMILVPVSKNLYEKLHSGQKSDIFNFEESEVETSLLSEYFFVEEICISNRAKAVNHMEIIRSLARGFFTAILRSGAKYITTSPITEEGTRLCQRLDFAFVSEEEYEGGKYPIYELIVTEELTNKFEDFINNLS